MCQLQQAGRYDRGVAFVAGHMGATYVPIEIGKSQFLLSAYVANDITSDSILGLGAKIYLNKGCLVANQEQLTLESQ